MKDGSSIVFADRVGNTHGTGDIVAYYSGVSTQESSLEKIIELKDLDAIFDFMTEMLPGGWDVQNGKVISIGPAMSHLTVRYYAPGQPTTETLRISKELEQEMAVLIKLGKVVGAVKRCREVYHCPLIAAKRMADAIQAHYKL